MVVFVDLDEECEPPEDFRLRLDWGIHGHNGTRGQYGVENVTEIVSEDAVKLDVMEMPSRTAIAEAMGCYPYVQLDTEWNTLAITILLACELASDH
jgi:hypothetical protein